VDHPPDGRNAGPNPTLEAAAQDRRHPSEASPTEQLREMGHLDRPLARELKESGKGKGRR
jgi:hypothetical protein